MADVIAVVSGGLLVIVLLVSLHPKYRPTVSLEDGVARLYSKVTGGRTDDELAAAFGRVVRPLFFTVTAVAGVIYLSAADMSVFHTPLAELTLAAIGQALGFVVFVIVASILWFRWAFSSEEKTYEGGHFRTAGADDRWAIVASQEMIAAIYARKSTTQRDVDEDAGSVTRRGPRPGAGTLIGIVRRMTGGVSGQYARSMWIPRSDAESRTDRARRQQGPPRTRQGLEATPTARMPTTASRGSGGCPTAPERPVSV